MPGFERCIVSDVRTVGAESAIEQTEPTAWIAWTECHIVLYVFVCVTFILARSLLRRARCVCRSHSVFSCPSFVFASACPFWFPSACSARFGVRVLAWRRVVRVFGFEDRLPLPMLTLTLLVCSAFLFCLWWAPFLPLGRHTAFHSDCNGAKVVVLRYSS